MHDAILLITTDAKTAESKSQIGLVFWSEYLLEVWCELGFLGENHFWKRTT